MAENILKKIEVKTSAKRRNQTNYLLIIRKWRRDRERGIEKEREGGGQSERGRERERE